MIKIRHEDIVEVAVTAILVVVFLNVIVSIWFPGLDLNLNDVSSIAIKIIIYMFVIAFFTVLIGELLQK